MVAGGGSAFAHISRAMAKDPKVDGRVKLAVESFAESLLCIPITIAENAGHDPLDISLALLAPFQAAGTQGLPRRAPHIETGKPVDMAKEGVIEPMRVVEHAIQSATEVAIAILRIDDIIGRRGEEQNGQVA